MSITFLFDSLVITFLIFGLFLFLKLWPKPKSSSSSQTLSCSKRIFLLIILTFFWLLAFYSSFIEPEIIIVNRQNIDLKRYQGRPFRLVLVSDFHANSYLQKLFFKRIVKKIKTLSPDFVFIAGDFIDSQKQQIKYLSSLQEITKQFPTFAVLGNHDYYGNLNEQELEKLQIQVLKNQAVLLKEKIWLIGVDDLTLGTPNLNQALKNIPDNNQIRLILTHNPDIILDPLSRQADLILTGHTHGGQLRLPFIGPLLPLPTHLGRKYDKGLFELNETKLFITSGVGNFGPRARLFNPPEIVILTIF
jgi:predicted MPP superfamily phosphohydrolase